MCIVIPRESYPCDWICGRRAYLYLCRRRRHYASIRLRILRAFLHRRMIAYWTYPYPPLQYRRIDIAGGPAGVIHFALMLLPLLL